MSDTATPVFGRHTAGPADDIDLFATPAEPAPVSPQPEPAPAVAQPVPVFGAPIVTTPTWETPAAPAPEPVADEAPNDSDDYQNDESGDYEDDDTAEAGGPRKRNRDHAAIRRAIVKYDQLLNARPEHLELLAVALGVKKNPVDITFTIMTGGRNAARPLVDAISLTGTDNPYDRLILAMTLGRARLRGVWAVLTELAAVTGQLPTSDVKAGGEVAKAIDELDEAAVAELNAVLQMARKH
ncbi:hypothetical protein [Leifsonia sp. Leaf264]|uniref:hypothetical protein n=1 Tax=Leifsonia sp. Leaf264 TaxID=1736314 RepID=UPI0006F7357F|nr:hypothetical protein [Leifsonia sp. Leaf264]KQO98746.1 hypothetical protein ASF30_11840 [Leifsonia sp. Leaf264]